MSLDVVKLPGDDRSREPGSLTVQGQVGSLILIVIGNLFAMHKKIDSFFKAMTNSVLW